MAYERVMFLNDGYDIMILIPLKALNHAMPCHGQTCRAFMSYSIFAMKPLKLSEALLRISNDCSKNLKLRVIFD